jgi:hypothetical protein
LPEQNQQKKSLEELLQQDYSNLPGWGTSTPESTKVDTTDYSKVDFSQSVDTTESEKENWFMKTFPIFKDAYNNTISGVAYEIINGRKKYNVQDRATMDKGILYDIGVQMLSFLYPTPENIALLAGGGFIGKGAQIAGGRKATEFVANKLIQKGLLSKSLEKGFVEDVSRIAFVEAGAFAAQEGMYSSVAKTKEAIINSEFDISKYQEIEDEGERYRAVLGDLFKQSNPIDYARGYGVGAIGSIGFGAGRYVKPTTLKIPTPSGVVTRTLEPLEKARNIERGIAAEIGSVMMASPMIYGRDISSEQPDATLGTFILASGIVAAAGLPRNVFNKSREIYRLQKGKVLSETGEVKIFGKDTGITLKPVAEEEKILRGLDRKEIKEIIPESVGLQSFLRRKSQVFQRFQEPLAEITGRPGDPIVNEQVALTIRDINKKQLPAGMASGAYANVEIFGKQITTATTKAGKAAPKIASELTEIPSSVNARIDRSSLKYTENGGFTFEVQVGRNKYILDEANSELFLKFYTSQPGLMKRFESRNKSFFQLTRVRRKALRDLRRDANRNFAGLESGDYKKAIEDVANQYGITKWLDKKADMPKIQNMSDIEMRLVTERLQDVQFMRNFETFIQKNFGAQLDNLSGIAGESTTLNFAKSLFGSIGNDVQSPEARTAIKLIALTDRNVVQRSIERVNNLQKIFGMDTAILSAKSLPKFAQKIVGYNAFKNEFLEKWIVGESVTLSNGTKISSGFDDYLKLDAKPDTYYQTMKKNTTRLINKGGLSEKEVAFLQRRLDIFPRIQTLMDEVYDDALSAKIAVAGRKKWYMPFVIKKDIRDTIYSNMISLNEKISKLTNELELDSLVALRGKTNAEKEALRETISDFIEKMAKAPDAKQRAFADIFNATKNEMLKNPSTLSDVPDYDVWANMMFNIYSDGFRPYAPLEKSRKILGSQKSTNVDVVTVLAKTKREMLDKNLITLFTDYIGGATKRIELSKSFMPDAAFLTKLIERIPETAELQGLGAALGRRMGDSASEKARVAAGKVPTFAIKERDAVTILKEHLTGEDSITRNNLFTRAAQTASQFEMTTKISLGTAVIPNLTQIFISALPQLGVAPVVKGLYNYATNPVLRDMIKSSGITGLSLWDELLGGNRALQIGQAKLVNLEGDLTKLWVQLAKGEAGIKDIMRTGSEFVGKPFMMVNLMNKVVSGAAAEEYIIKLVKMYDGQKGFADLIPGLYTQTLAGNRKAYAKAKLRKYFNLDADELLKNKDAILNRTYGPDLIDLKRKILRGMENYAQFSQQGRDLALDALGFADSFTKPATLFKRFPIRQAKYARDMVEFELVHGNIIQPLQMAASGAFGGSLAIWGVQQLKQALSGDENFYGLEAKTKLLQTRSGKEFVDNIVGAGVVGIYGDIIRDSEPLNAIEFAVKPVMFDDMERLLKTGWSAVTNLYANEDPLNIQARKIMKNLGPVLGSGFNNFMKRYLYSEWNVPIVGGPAVPGMERDAAENERGRVYEDIQQYLFAGNSERALELAQAWNASSQVEKFKGLAINPFDTSTRNPFSNKSLFKKMEQEVNKNKDKYEMKLEDIDWNNTEELKSDGSIRKFFKGLEKLMNLDKATDRYRKD